MKVLHAGTALDGDGQLRVAGGRVLVVQAQADTLDEARLAVYRGVDKISFPGMQARRDIAKAAASTQLAWEVGSMIAAIRYPRCVRSFNDEERMRLWLEVEILAVEAWAQLGVIPAEHAAEVRKNAPIVDAAFVEEVNERERVTDHDVAGVR